MDSQALRISEEFLFLQHICSLKKVAEEETPFYRCATRGTEIVYLVCKGGSVWCVEHRVPNGLNPTDAETVLGGQ